MFRYRYYYVKGRRRGDRKITDIVNGRAFISMGNGWVLFAGLWSLYNPGPQRRRPRKLFRKLNKKKTKTANINRVRNVCVDKQPRRRCVGVRNTGISNENPDGRRFRLVRRWFSPRRTAEDVFYLVLQNYYFGNVIVRRVRTIRKYVNMI